MEYYFSQFLSAMEEDLPEERRITLLSQQAHRQLHHPWAIPREIYLPDNLLFTGTINVDETTQSVSDKVIDRANTIDTASLPGSYLRVMRHPTFAQVKSVALWMRETHVVKGDESRQ